MPGKVRVYLGLAPDRILHRALHGDLTKTAGEDVRVRGSALVNAGILRRTPAGGFELTDDAAYSLARDT